MALKERGIAFTRIVRKGASRYPSRLLQLKKANRGLVWGALQASIIGGICCRLWQDSNAVMVCYSFFFFFYFFLLILRSNILKKYVSKCLNSSVFLVYFMIFKTTISKTY
jgi:hypothetical protein